MRDIDQIRRAHANAKPKPSNPAWCNTHRDLGIVLDEIDALRVSINSALELDQVVPEVNDFGGSLAMVEAQGYETNSYVDYDRLKDILSGSPEPKEDNE